MNNTKAIITKEEMVNTLRKWGASDYIERMEKILGRELDGEDCKKILLNCMGYVSSIDDMLEALQ